ncbi:hypothetical protein RRG08_061771 [Elysia crispata]|uniref:Cytochrome P450 n=1 Tax=Elysia crispata TaxID=231223 RepID=A0AAE1A8H2_9GAST|nr:hypothetical protein RRG08_061771 [Elysia crispata]
MYDRAFAHNRLGSYFKTFQKSADVIVQQWSARGKDELFPICEETFKFVLRSSMCSMLGEYCENDEVVYNFRKAYLKANEELSKIPGDPAHCEDPKAMERFQEALTFMRKTVKCALEYHRTTTSHGNLAVDEIVEYASDEETVICDCITYLFASFHNTGKMLSICLFYLAKHEDIQDKLYTEILKVLGNSQLVDESNLRSLKYMRQVIDESIRCGAFGAFAARYQDVDITLGGYKILKNTPVVQALGIVMRDEKIWPMPMKFDPDRFNEENTKARSPFAFKPFGFSGKRACPGTKLVYRESSVLLATILRRFKIELHGDQQIEIEHGLATHSTEEIWAKLVKR